MSEQPSVKPRNDARVEALLRETELRLRRQNEVLVDLARRQAGHPNLADALRDISEAAARTLDVERVAVWFYTPDRSAIRCAELFDRGSNQHSEGVELLASMYPLYFRALETERTISVHDAFRDPRTAAFTEDYLRPRNIVSVLDAPIRHVGQIAGVICYQHTGAPRFWTIEDENFASSLADLVAMAIDATERRQAQESLRHRLEFEKLISGISTHFINVDPEELDASIHEALAAIAKFTGADRANVVLMSDDRKTATMTHEWVGPGIDSRKHVAQSLPVTHFRWTLETLSRSQNIYIHKLDDLPPEAQRERETHERFNTKSLLAVPMIANRTLLGYLGINSTQQEDAFSEETIGLLRIAGEIFLGAIQRNRAERALRSSEKRHRLLFERNLAGVYRNTIDGAIVDCNDALAQMLGYESREDLKAHMAGDLYFDPVERKAFIEKLRAEKTLTSIEICLRRKDGKPVWLVESVHLLGGENGEPEFIEGTLIDITDRKMAENALRESERSYRLLVERMREGLAQVDNDGTFLFVNDRYCEMVGYSHDELIGRNADTLIAFPEDVELMHSKSELRKQGISDQYEVRARRKDGTVIWLEIGGAPVRDADDNVVGSIGVHNDITERRRAEEALRESEARYRLMAENSTDMISRSTPEGTIVYASEASRRLLGYEPAEITGRSVYEFVLDTDREEVRYLSRLLLESGPMTFSYRVRRKDGTVVWFETTSRAIGESDTGRIQEIISVSRDVSERKRAEEQIEFQAYHDALTGLPNRLLFRDRLTVALAHARRLKQPLAVMFLDLDRFKLVNDTLGHSLGDELLKGVAGRLRSALREEDSIARMGGDEFTLLLSDLESADDAVRVAQKLLETIAQPISLDGHELFITTSIGIALFPADGDNAEELLQNADNAMYRAKEAGRNSCQLCTPAMNSRALERLSLESSLRRALDRGEFLLHYQPQFHLATGHIVGIEALLRWNHPQHGVVEPARYIPIAEETRLIVPIGEWVLREACRQAKAWQSRLPRLRMAVNLSPRQFQSTDLRKLIASALDESGLGAQFLELEITEGTAMQNTERTVATLKGLREMGMCISIDDFGTGHSALNYLRSFPIDSIKIDQTFVHEIETSQSARAIVSAVITMAHGLGLRVTAEGVETQTQMHYLREQGCEEVQGFLLGRPKAAGELL